MRGLDKLFALADQRQLATVPLCYSDSRHASIRAASSWQWNGLPTPSELYADLFGPILVGTDGQLTCDPESSRFAALALNWLQPAILDAAMSRHLDESLALFTRAPFGPIRVLGRQIVVNRTSPTREPIELLRESPLRRAFPLWSGRRGTRPANIKRGQKRRQPDSGTACH